MTDASTEKKSESPLKRIRIAIIRIKGKPGLKPPVKKTLELLCLYRKHHCIVVPNTPPYMGMLEIVKDAVTWGEVDEPTFKLMLEKRGKLPSKKPLTEAYLKEKLNTTPSDFAKDFMSFKKEVTDIPGMKKFFKLSPPKKGFEKKGLKVPFSMGGVVGYRKNKINELLQRMV